MLNRNPGLRDISHSITGGALAAQGNVPIIHVIPFAKMTGYWLPFEAAKAVAANFCWPIRYALTPIFGCSFPSSCLPPESEDFGNLIIDSAIVKRCRMQAEAFKALEVKSVVKASSGLHSPLTPDSWNFPSHTKEEESKTGKLEPMTASYDSESTTDDYYTLAPDTPPPNAASSWTSLNTPRSVPSGRLLPQISEARASKTSSLAATSDTPLSRVSSSELSPNTKPGIGEDCDYDGDGSSESSCDETGRVLDRSVRLVVQRNSDEDAAALLVGLSMGRRNMVALCRSKKRRAST